MKTYTAHLHRWKSPVLVPEAFSWGALFFGPLWLLRHGAWIPAILVLAVFVLACLVPLPPLRPVAAFGVLVLAGLMGQDWRRLHLRLRRFELAHVIAARTLDEAWFRLLSHRDDVRELAV